MDGEKRLRWVGVTLAALLLALAGLMETVNSAYRPDAEGMRGRIAFIRSIHLASPALATAGRNIAFETGNAVSNAPASYLTMLDCCESDEAIADRIAVSRTTCTIKRKPRENFHIARTKKAEP